MVTCSYKSLKTLVYSINYCASFGNGLIEHTPVFLICNFSNMLHKDSDEARRQRARQGLAEGTCDFLLRFMYFAGIQKLKHDSKHGLYKCIDW